MTRPSTRLPARAPTPAPAPAPALTPTFSRALAPAFSTALSLVIAVAATTAQAQPAPSIDSTQALPLQIAAQPLAEALNDWARQTGIQIVVEQGAVAGKTAPAVAGTLTPRQALEQLLAGSGLFGRREGDLVTVERLPAAPPGRGETSLAPVTVTARTQRAATTEGSGLYTSAAVLTGKEVQALRDIPQSITVITRQRIEDQGLTSIGEVMEQTVGVTLENTGYNGASNAIYSRGFRLGNVQIDGAAIDGFGQVFSPNLAMFDSVQVLRGADGLYGGTGAPGGSVNLVRKRPTRERQVLVNASIGRWDQYRAEVDVAGPLALDGRLRGRALVSHVDRRYFYDFGKARGTLLYGILEADVTPSTVVTVGASYERIDDAPWRSGLPRYANGEDLGLPRRTSLMASWNDRERTNAEVFGQLEQRLAGDWRLRLHANYIRSASDIVAVDGAGAIDPGQGLIPSFGISHKQYGGHKQTLDLNASGSFRLLGREHRALVGADWQQIKNDEYNIRVDFDPELPPTPIFGFDPRSIPEPSLVWRGGGYPDWGATQKGIYGRLNLSLTDRLMAVVGGRLANYEYTSPFVGYDRAGNITDSETFRYRETGIFTPYAGLTYTLNPRWTAYASLTDIYQSQASRMRGPAPGTPLEAIEGRNYELGVKGELAGGALTTGFALYRIERTGESAPDPAYPTTDIGDQGLTCCYIAQGEIISQGVEAEVSGQLAPGWQLTAGYAYNHNSNEITQLVYHSTTPKHQLKLWTTYNLPGAAAAWMVGGGVTTQSATFVSGTANTFNPESGRFNGPSVPFRFSQAGYAVWNAVVHYRINRHWSATLNANNLFDKTYYKQVGSSTGGNWYGDPRNVMLGLRGRF